GLMEHELGLMRAGRPRSRFGLFDFAPVPAAEWPE
ncbi:MAG: hypothetical protein ACI9E1_002028, partial [Cryomorphaceae bacterium]